MSNPLVSIIVPIYKVEKYLPQCLDSLIGQTYPHLEIIAIDDGSPDGSGKILDEYAAKDDRIVAVHQQNSGVSEARNKAMALAKGEYVLFVDADDWIDLQSVSVCLERIEESAADVCMFCYSREFAEHSELRRLFDGDKEFDRDGCRRLQTRMLGPMPDEVVRPEMLDSFGTIWGKLYRREIIENLRFVDLAELGTAEDSLFNCQAFLLLKKAIYIDTPFYHYRKTNEDSQTKDYKPDLYVRWQSLFSRMSVCAVTPEARKALETRIALSILGLGLNECNSSHPAKEKISRLREILQSDPYHAALQSLSLYGLPLHWKIFYLSARHGQVCVLWTLLSIIHHVNK